MSLRKKIFNAFKKVGKTTRTYLQNSSAHGHHYLVDAGLHWTERIFWLFFITISSALGTYMMITSTYDCLQNPVSVTVNTLYLDWETNFPAVIFCESFYKLDENIVFSYFKADIDNYWEDEAITVTEAASVITFFYDYTLALRNCDETGSNYNEKLCLFKTNFSETSAKFRRTCSEIFNKCTWNNEEFSCCNKFHPMYTTLGKCFAINSIVSNPPTTEMLTFSYKDDPKLTVDLYTTDVRVYVLSSEETISSKESRLGYICGKDDNIVLENQKGLDVFIRIQEMYNEQSIRSIAKDIRKCRYPDESDLVYSKVYSYPACIVDQIASTQKELCGCIQHFMPGALSYKEMCTDISSLVCTYDEGISVNASSNSQCDMSCVEAEIDIIGTLESKPTFEDNETVSRLNFIVTPPTLRYERRVVRDTAYLIVNVGGIGCLFFGASILSILEIIYYFFVYPCNETKVEPAKQKKSKTPIIDVIQYSRYQQDELVIQKKGFSKRKPFPYVN